MRDFFTKKVVSLFSSVLLVVFSIGITLAVCFFPKYQPLPSADELYEAALKDSMTIEESETAYRLITVTKSEELIRWDEEGERVLLVTWHKYPGSYPKGEEVEVKWGYIWTFTDREIEKKYAELKDGNDDIVLRLEQLIGLPPNKGHTHFTAMWVYPSDIIRPAYNTSITSPSIYSAFDSRQDDAEFVSWFNSNILYSYFEDAYVWSRLGYTYDWSDGGSEYGLTEFLVKNDSVVEVEYTYTVEEFIEHLDSTVLAK